MDGESFDSGEKNLRIKKYPDACEPRGLGLSGNRSESHQEMRSRYVTTSETSHNYEVPLRQKLCSLKMGLMEAEKLMSFMIS